MWIDHYICIKLSSSTSTLQVANSMRHQGGSFQYKDAILSVYVCLIFIMEISVLGKTVFILNHTLRSVEIRLISFCMSFEWSMPQHMFQGNQSIPAKDPRIDPMSDGSIHQSTEVIRLIRMILISLNAETCQKLWNTNASHIISNTTSLKH